MYNLTDLHLHTKFSWDAQQKLDELAKRAAERGLSYICTTEHIDLMDEHAKNYTKFDYDGYTAAHYKNRAVFPGLLKGIEAGEVHVFADRFEKFMEGREFDFVLGSVHSIGDVTPVFDEYFMRHDSVVEAYKKYLEEEYKLVKHGGFDAAAHVTLVHRQGARFFKDPVYASFKEEIDDILKMMISNRIALEVNTSGLTRFPAKDFIPDEETVRAYLALGGDMVTVGSDSHRMNDAFTGLEKAYKMLDGLGVREVTVFVKRKPIKVEIIKQ
jgi:histidinol-phosphatase (PHP family)